MQARARVLRVERGKAWVKLSDKAGGCGRCDEPGGCRSMQITQALGAGKDEFALPLVPGIGPGDDVVISIPDGAALRAALASYGLATVLLVSGAGLGGLFADGRSGDTYALAGGLAGLLLAWATNRVLARSRNWRLGLRMDLASASACVQGGPQR